MSGLHPEPNLADPAEALVHRAISAVKRAFKEEFKDDPLSPNVTVVVSVPPDGRVGIASTEPDASDILLALQMGLGCIMHAERLRREGEGGTPIRL